MGIIDYGQWITGSLAVAMFVKPSPTTLWFVTMLIPLYLISPYLSWIARNRHQFVVVSVSIFVALLLYSKSFSTMDNRLLVYFFAFCAGIWVARHQEEMTATRLSPIVLLAIGSTLFSFTVERNVESSLRCIPLAVFPALLTLLTAVKYGGRIQTARWINFISVSSYFMYLFHRPIYSMLRDIYFPANGMRQLAYLLFVCLPVVLACSYVGQKAYDKVVFSLVDSRRNVFPKIRA
jgi:peptidoglycan/LPS O-acetylase OafA/YrhL